jgi:hypothetical protein
MNLNSSNGAACSGERISRYYRWRVLIIQLCSLHRREMVMQQRQASVLFFKFTLLNLTFPLQGSIRVPPFPQFIRPAFSHSTPFLRWFP